eukprot:11163521-Lingulodinium_polyedra.AAC.1
MRLPTASCVRSEARGVVRLFVLPLLASLRLQTARPQGADRWVAARPSALLLSGPQHGVLVPVGGAGEPRRLQLRLQALRG